MAFVWDMEDWSGTRHTAHWTGTGTGTSSSMSETKRIQTGRACVGILGMMNDQLYLSVPLLVRKCKREG